MEHQKDQEPPVPVSVPSDIPAQQVTGIGIVEPSIEAEARPASPLLGAIGGASEQEAPSVKLRYTLDDDGTKSPDKRTRALTERGLEYQLTMKRKALKHAMKAWQRKAYEVQDTLIDITYAEEVRRLRDEVMEVFNEVERVHEDLTTISPEDEHAIDFVCNEHRQIRSEINLKLRELVNEGSQSKSKGSRSHRSSHSSRSAKSMRLEQATKAAELAVRLKYYQKETEVDRMKLEADRIKLEKDAEAERIKLEKDLAITQAKLRVIDQGSASQKDRHLSYPKKTHKSEY